MPDTPPVTTPAAETKPANPAPAAAPAAVAEVAEFTKSQVKELVAAELKREKDEAAKSAKSAADAAALEQARKDGDTKKELDLLKQQIAETNRLREETDKGLAEERKARKAAERLALVQRIASEKKLTPREAVTLKGESEAEIAADADAALKERGTTYAAAVPAKPTPGGPAGHAVPVNGEAKEDYERARAAMARAPMGI